MSSPGASSSALSTQRMLELRRAMDTLPNDLSPHARHKVKKNLYRRMRTKAFEDAWEQSIAERAKQAEEETKRDADRAAAVRDALQLDEAQRQREIALKKEEQRKIAEVNKALSFSRKQLPSAELPCDIFNARLRTYSARHDTTALEEQLRERRERDASDKEADKALRRDMDRDYQSFLQAEERKRRDVRAERVKQLEEYGAEAASRLTLRRTMAMRDVELEASLPGMKFTQEAEKQDSRMAKIRQDNFELANERAKQLLEKEATLKLKAEAERLRHERRDKMLSQQEQRSKRVVQDVLREAWEHQMVEKKRREKELRDADRRWKGTVFLKNESSDDDDA